MLYSHIATPRWDQFLAATEFEFATIWLIPRIYYPRLPGCVGPDVELDRMTDEELAAVLDVEVPSSVRSSAGSFPER